MNVLVIFGIIGTGLMAFTARKFWIEHLQFLVGVIGACLLAYATKSLWINHILGLAGITGITMVAYALRSFWKESKEGYAEPLYATGPGDTKRRDSRNIENKNLADISHIWEGDVIYLKDIAHIWRDIVPDKPELKYPCPAFEHKELNSFFNKYVDKPVVRGNRRTIIIKLLKIIDENGNCPSIVGRGKFDSDSEPERNFSQTEYDCFTNIPLWKHIITVTIRYINKFEYKDQLPDALIVALGHDIGLIEKEYSKYYLKLTHPEVSLLILKSIPEFNLLVNRSELNSIIKHHHSITNIADSKLLKSIVKEVRNKEYLKAFPAESIQSTTEGNIDVNAERDLSNESPASKVTPDSLSEVSYEENTTEETEHQDEAESDAGETQDVHTTLPHWFNLDATLIHIGKHINIMVRIDDIHTWYAYSVTEGYVWVKEELLWDAILVTSDDEYTQELNNVDSTVKSSKLNYVLSELWNRGILAKELLSEGVYKKLVIIKSAKGKPTSAYLIPFYTRAFGIPPEELEERKSSVISKTVDRIVLKAQEDQTP